MDSDFDLNLLRLLVALDRTRHITRAAQLLGMSQSGFSTALARLRRHCDDALFVRAPGGMAPTPRAAEMVATAHRVMGDVQQGVLARPGFDAATARTEFRIAMADVAEVVFLPRLLRHCQSLAPGVTFSCASLSSAELSRAMEAGTVDLALGYFPDLIGPGFHEHHLLDHTYACMLRNRHPALRKPITDKVYRELGHAVVASPARTNELFERFTQRRRIDRRVVLETPHHMSLPAIIEATDLIATVPLATGARFSTLGAVQLVPLPFAPPVFKVQQHWHRRVHQDARVGWLRAQVGELFNAQTDEWRALTDRLYPALRKRATGAGKR